MADRKFERLLRRGLTTSETLEACVREAQRGGRYVEELLIARGVPKHEVLFCLAAHYGRPFAEYDEGIVVSQNILRRMDVAAMRRGLWVPLSAGSERAEVIVYDPDDGAVIAQIQQALGAAKLDLVVALPSDIIRIIENNQDLNPGFPASGGRTPLAKVRTFLAGKRSAFACYRTSLAKGRTGLAFLRTGISFIAIAIVLFRVFGLGYLTILEVLLLAAGILMVADGLVWYMPGRKAGKRRLACTPTEPSWGTTLLEVSNPGNDPIFTRTPTIDGAESLRADWHSLSPVMRRRFLASDRTDFAEERTTLACYRTVMARARTGLAFTRTGVAFIGLGIALLRQFHTGPWTVFDLSLILTGVVMASEGFYWYLPGRRAGSIGFASVRKSERKSSIWDFVFPPAHALSATREVHPDLPPVRPTHAPGIWATTGLALERTVLADRRNVMARLRTVMARSRTGLAFIRTGMSIFGVGTGLMVYFGTANTGWTAFNALLLSTGLVFISDGLYWHVPAERLRKQFPYCFGEMEITVPDYGRPARSWKTAVFDHDDN
jgi:uncharacterized membrane protein YidH (DUF202 family)